MEKLIDKNLIDKISKRATKKLRINEVNFNTDLELKTIEYLKKQQYLEYKKVEIVLKNNFIPSYPLGYVLINHYDKIVGFMGTIFSIRNIKNKEYTYCNIHTWVVDRDYRLNSFLLLTDLIKKDITLTAFTPVKTLIGLLEKFGFKKIKMKYRIIFLLNFLKLLKKNQYEIEKKSLVIEKILNENDLNYYKNYLHIPCEKFVIIDKNDRTKYIFIIARKVKKKIFQVLNIFYVSDSLNLKNNWDSISLEISKVFKVSFCVQNFFNESDCSIPNKILFIKNLKKDICIKNLPKNLKLDILYSDLIE